MARKSPAVSRCERITTETTEPTLSGDYQTRDIDKRAWRCNGCQLVWSRRGYAEGCASRGHASTWQDGPYYSGPPVVLNGVYQGNVRYYPRTALRRDPAGDAMMLQKDAMPPMPSLASVLSAATRAPATPPALPRRVLDRLGGGGQRLRMRALLQRPQRPGQSEAARHQEIFGK